MDASRAVVACIGVCGRVVRQPKQETAFDAGDLLDRFAVEIETVELAGLAAGIGAAVGTPGDSLGMVERIANIGELQRLGFVRHELSSMRVTRPRKRAAWKDLRP